MSAADKARKEADERASAANAAERRAMFGPREDADKPEGILRSAYDYYIDVKQCVDVREGYERVYLTDQQMQNAKKYVAGIDKKLNVATRDMGRGSWQGSELGEFRK